MAKRQVTPLEVEQLMESGEIAQLITEAEEGKAYRSILEVVAQMR